MKIKLTNLFLAGALIGAFLFTGCSVRTENREHSRHYYHRHHMPSPDTHSELRVDVRP
jgi:hypothetical protein